MKSRVLNIIALFVVLLLGACRNEPDTPKPKPLFTIDIKAVTESSVEIVVTPRNNDLGYIAMITPKAYYDTFEDDEEAFISDDLSWFYDIAYEEGISYEEAIQSRLNRGKLEIKQNMLDPNTEYYVYAYGLSDSGFPTTPLYKELFRTASPDMVELSFEITLSGIDYNEVTMHVTPDDTKAFYFMNVFSAEDYEYYGGDESAFANHLTALRNYYFSKGATTEQMVANLGAVGAKELKVEKLKAGTKYMAYAIGINTDFIANSEATFVEFETKAAEASDMTFEVEITKVYYDRIEGTVTPSNNEESYICSIQSAASLEWYDSDEALMEAIISDIKQWGNIKKSLRQGVISLNDITGLAPETEYVVVCFGYEGAPTTAPYVTRFTTPEAVGEADMLTVEFEISDITHNSVTITTTPSEAVHYFTFFTAAEGFDAKSAELGSVDGAVAYYADWEINYGAEFFGCSRAEYLSEIGACIGKVSSPYTQLEPSTEYIAYAIAVDITTGEIISQRGSVSETFWTLDKVTSEAKVKFIFGDYYDGSALAELDPAQFLGCKGMAVLPYTIEASDAAEWYTTFSSGDYTEWGCTDDDIYAELITYGYNFGVETIAVNKTSGVAVLPYDSAYTFLGIAKDEAGAFGLGTLEVVTLTRDGVSSAEEFINAQ